MPQYFSGRRRVADHFEISISGHKKVLCTVYKFWEDRPGYECACSQERKITVEKAWGISKKDSESIESTLESSLGIEGVAMLKSDIKGATATRLNGITTRLKRASLNAKHRDADAMK